MCRFCEQASLGEQAPYDPQLGRDGFIPGSNMPPDLILCDGPILTMDDAQPEATAVAIGQGVIRAVGRTDEVLARRGRATRVVKLDGQAVLPGFIGNGLRLPEARDRAALDRWIEGRARAGYTTVNVTSLGGNWREYDTLNGLIDRRHRLRLRGAVEEGLRRDWQEGDLSPGHGNDLVRIEALHFGSPARTEAIDLALSMHRQGWGAVFECQSEGDLAAALRMAAAGPGGGLAGLCLHARRQIGAEEGRILVSAGLSVVAEAEGTPAETLSGSRDAIIARIDRLTRQAARASGVSGIAGQIKPGYYADFTVLDRSPLWPGAGAPNVIGTWIEGVPVRPEVEAAA